MSQKKLYMVGIVNREMSLNTGAPIIMEWADGQYGVCPVFSTKRAAEKFAKQSGGVPVIKLVCLSTGGSR